MHHHFFVIKRAKFGQSSSGLGGRPFAGSLTPSLRRREIKRNRPAIRVRGSPRSGGCFFAHGRCQGEPGGPGRSDTASDIQSLRPAPHLGDALASNGFFKEPARSNQATFSPPEDLGRPRGSPAMTTGQKPETRGA